MAIISFKCPNCGGELIFDPATQKYKCEYCNSLFTQEELDAMKPMQGEEPEAAAQERAAQAAAGAAAPSFFPAARWAVCSAKITASPTTYSAKPSRPGSWPGCFAGWKSRGPTTSTW